MSKESYSFEQDIKKLGESQTDLSKVSELLLNSQYKRRKTILRRNVTIGAISTLDALSQIWDIKFLKEWIPTYCEYLTSEGGRGRQDIVDITKFSIDKEKEYQSKVLEAMGRR